MAGRLAAILGAGDVFTFAAQPALARNLFAGRTVHAHRLGLTALGRERWPWLLPAMPEAWARLDLSRFDLVVTSAHSCVNAIRIPVGARHVSYCHTPMRYAWDWRTEIRRIPPPLRPAWPAVASALRRADRRWAQGVTAFIANSRHVAARIRACYGRDATVVHPPVDVRFWTPSSRGKRREEFFLFAGRLVPYKRPDVAVRAARLAGAQLVVAGAGPELRRLRRLAGEHVRFVVHPSRDVLRDLYRRARAVLNPGVEDFGMTMAEAQACGTPVIARAAGGAMDIVADGGTGVLYEDASPAGLSAVLREFDPGAFPTDDTRSSAERFAPERFDDGVLRVIANVARSERSVEGDGEDRAAWPTLADAG